MTTRKTFRSLVAELEKDEAVGASMSAMKPSHDLAMMLAGIRLRNGWSQAEFARRAGVSQPYIAQLESGTANPSIRKLHALLWKAGIELRIEAVASGQQPEIRPAGVAAGG